MIFKDCIHTFKGSYARAAYIPLKQDIQGLHTSL
jgi:hypothetical protein